LTAYAGDAVALLQGRNLLGQFGVGEWPIEDDEAGDLAVEGLLSGVLDRVPFLPDR
jgi:hypothetical protein